MSARRKRKKIGPILVVVFCMLIGSVLVAVTDANFFKTKTSLYFVKGSGEKTSNIEVEVADTDKLRGQGLMFRKKLPKNSGMLFIFPEQSRKISMWMKNTYISLDMIFITEDKTVVGVLENIPILNNTRRTIEEEAKYLLEVNAGTAKRLGIEKGSRMEIVGDDK